MLDVFHDKVGVRYQEELAVQYAFQELEPLPGGRVSPPGRIKPWGTGHAVIAAGAVVNDPFVVINADDYYGPTGFVELAQFLSTRFPASEEYAMVGFRLDQTLSEHGSVSRGICRTNKNGFLLDIQEHKSISRIHGVIVDQDHPSQVFTGSEWTSMNFWGFTPSLFARLEEQFEIFLNDGRDVSESEFYLPAAISSLISSGEATVRLLRSPDPWFGLTYPNDREHVTKFLSGLVGY